MILKSVRLENYTVFEGQTIRFSHGVNLFTGESGCGKTHLLKLLYSACQSVRKSTSFPYKLVCTMLPDEYQIGRLQTRKQGDRACRICVTAGSADSGSDRVLTMSFHEKTKKWGAEITGEEGWEHSFAGCSSIFIPAGEILSHSYNLNAAAQVDNVRFDDTYLDILNAAKVNVSAGRRCASKEVLLEAIEELIHGTVLYDAKRDEFYLKQGNEKQEFNLVAEGVRKLALLWQLIKNGTLGEGSVLFWDEPEANLSPSCIPADVEILLQLQRNGVQVFLTTHSYLVATYFEVRKTELDRVLFHSLFCAKDADELRYAAATRFDDLSGNTIIAQFNKLLDEVYYDL